MIRILECFACLTVTIALCGPPRAAAAELAVEPCSVEGLAEPARCGVLPVALEPGSEGGETLDLNLVILPARGEHRSPDPLVVIQGGPGQGASGLASFYGDVFRAIGESRDVILLDQRGTGRSAPLACDPLAGASLQEALDEFLPVGAVRRCREELAGTTRLDAYGTVEAVADLEALRRALGGPRLNLYGTSYGTRVALAYAARFPHGVRSLVLKGVVPPAMRSPLEYPQTGETALQRLIDDCLSDPLCGSAFPDLRSRLALVLARLEQDPVHVAWTDPGTGMKHPLVLHRDVFADTLRTLLYAPSAAVQIPRLVAAAARGDYQELIDSRMRYVTGAPRALSLGMFLSVTCGEDLPWIEPTEAAAAGADTAFRDWRWRRQAAACEEWPIEPVPASRLFEEDFESPVPTLLVSGWFDPVTPPAAAEEAARHLPHASHLVVRNGSHSFDNLGGCVESIIADFVRDGFAGRLDTSCADRIELPAFPTGERAQQGGG